MTPQNRRIALITALVGLVIVLPVGVAVSLRWVDLPWADPSTHVPAPEWVQMPSVRATTSDGTVVKTRVALDVQSSSAKGQIQRNVQQVGLLLETSVAVHTRDELRSREDISSLSEDMTVRLNEWLGTDDAVRSVAIQDLLINPE